MVKQMPQGPKKMDFFGESQAYQGLHLGSDLAKLEQPHFHRITCEYVQLENIPYADLLTTR